MAPASVTPTARTPASAVDRWPAGCAALAVVLGTGLRVQQWLHARPLWLDEAMLSLNLLGRDYAGLTRPLDSDQSAPVPFLWAVKLSAGLFGSGERALRLPALLGSVAAVLLIFLVARRLLQPWAAALAVLMAALSPTLLYYSNEVKPYGLDAAVAAGLALLTLRLMEQPASPPRWAALLAAGIGASLATTPAPFLLGGVGLALVADPGVRSSRLARLWLPACAVLWSTAFLLVYVALYRDTARNPYMQRFWLDFFLDPRLPGLAEKSRAAVGLLFRDLLIGSGGGWRQSAALLYAVPLVVGVAALARRRLALALLLAVPLLAAFAASAASRYPVAPRLLLFGGPALILLVVTGTSRMTALAGQKPRALLAGLAGAAILLLPAREALQQVRAPLEREAIAPLAEWFLRDHRPGAAVYVPGRTVPAWLYYTTDWSAPDLPRLRRLTAAVSSTGPLFYQRPSRGGPVESEGDAFRFPCRDWLELIGVPPGRGPDSTGRRRVGTDPGWAENEVRRLFAAGTPEVWLVATTYELSEPDPLGLAMVAAGAREVARRTVAGGFATRFELPRPGPSPLPPGP